MAGCEGPPLPLQVLSCASHVAHTSSCVCVCSACHHVTFPPAAELHCLSPVTSLSHLLLVSPHWLVRHKALEAVKEYAQVCPVLHIMRLHVVLLGKC